MSSPQWFVEREGRTYGPYHEQQLAAFLTGESRVRISEESPWRLARDVKELQDVLSGRIVPVAEWYLTHGGQERGPYARHAVLSIMERKEIGPSDKIRHESWDEPVELSRTRFYHVWKSAGADDAGEEMEKLPSARRRRIYPSSVAVGAAGRASEMIARIRNLTLARQAILLTLLLGPAAGYFGYEEFYVGSALADRWEVGAVKGACADDEISRKLCARNASRCGCVEKGACSMNGCRQLAVMRKHQMKSGR